MTSVVKALGYRLIVKPDPIEETSPGGIIIAQDKKLERAGQITGTIISIGSLCWTGIGDGEPWAKIGDRIHFSRYAGRYIEDPSTGENNMIMNDEDVLAVIEETPSGD
jgi:co-chaperonin GroES (HSP10)